MEKEKPSKMKAMFLAFLPKAASPVSFQLSPPWSPTGKSPAARKGTPVIPIIPKEVRGEMKTDSFVAREPGSPEISCMGRVKSKKRKSTIKPKEVVLHPVQETKPVSSRRDVKKRAASMTSFFMETTTQDHRASAGEKEPSLGQIKKYASSRGALRDFDWRDYCEEEEEEEDEEE